MRYLSIAIILILASSNASAWGWNAEKEATKAAKRDLSYSCSSYISLRTARPERAEVYKNEILKRDVFTGRDLRRVLDGRYGEGMSSKAWLCVFSTATLESESVYGDKRLSPYKAPLWSSNLHATFIDDKLYSYTSIPF